MKTLAWLSAFGFVAFSGVLFGLDKDRFLDSPSNWKLQIDLIDGSRIIGAPTEKELKLDVGFSHLSIPLERVRRAEWDRHRKSMRVELVNHDMISGEIMMKHIAMDTLFGDIVLKTKMMRSLEVILGNRLGGLPSERDLILYYSFDRDDGERVINHASDQLSGKATGVCRLPEGIRGAGIEFDGNASIEIPHHETLCPATLTMAAWIYPRTSSASYELVIAKTDGGSWNQGFGLVRRSGESNHLTFFVNNYSSSGAKAEVALEEWSHIAGVFDGEVVRIYLNGVQAGTADATCSAPDTSAININHTQTSMYLGRDPSGYNWNGKMDELVLYSRALEPAEIERLYRAGTPR